MCPIRHEDDFRRVEIDDWDSWIEEQIQESQERGEFDDLPHAGKPIHIYRTDVNPDYDLAFSRMKNAGVLPAWMELDRDVSRLTRELAHFLDRSATWLLAERDAYRDSLADRRPEQREEAMRHRWWQLWARLRDWMRVEPEPPAARRVPASLGEVLRTRDHIRAQYLERAATLDRKIEEYHNALPRGLSHLQRLRMLPSRAERLFDERIPARVILDADARAPGTAPADDEAGPLS
jgi:hypothetical protein